MTNIKYYPTYWSGCTPLHAVTNWSLVRRFVRMCKKGDATLIPPIFLWGDRNFGAFQTGTHRAAANDIIEMLNERHGTNIELIDYIDTYYLLTQEQLDQLDEIDGDLHDYIMEMIYQD